MTFINTGNIQGSVFIGNMDNKRSIHIGNITTTTTVVYSSGTHKEAITKVKTEEVLKAEKNKSLENQNYTTVEVKGFLKVKNITADELKAGRFIVIKNCKRLGSVTAGDYLDINNSMIEGDAIANGDAEVNDSTIKGTLTCSSEDLLIKNSEIGELKIKLTASKMAKVAPGMIQGQKEAIINTGVIRGNVYFEDQGYGSEGLNNNNSSMLIKSQQLVLKNSKVGNITFEGGEGAVILIGKNSAVTGKITGGMVKKDMN